MTGWQFDYLMFAIMTGFGWTLIPDAEARRLVGWGFSIGGIFWLAAGIVQGLS